MKFKNGYYIAALWIALLLGFKVSEKMDEKKIKVEFTFDEWNKKWKGFEDVKSGLKSSNLPYQTVVYLADSIIGKFQTELQAQIIPQMQDTTAVKKPKK